MRALASRALAALTGAARGGDHRLLGDRRRPVRRGLGRDRDCLSAGRRALLGRATRDRFASASRSRPRRPCSLRSATSPRAAARTSLMRAMPRILEALPDAHCVIAGDPFPRPQDIAFRDELIELIAELGIEDSVIVAGHYERGRRRLRGRRRDRQPGALQRTLRPGPVRGGDRRQARRWSRSVGAIPELLRDGRSALIVAPEDPEALAEAVIRVLADPELAATLVAGAREIVAARLTPGAQPRRLPPRGRAHARARVRGAEVRGRGGRGPERGSARATGRGPERGAGRTVRRLWRHAQHRPDSSAGWAGLGGARARAVRVTGYAR